MSATVVDKIGDLLRDRPPFDAPDGERAAWLAHKAEVLDAIATEAEAEPGHVDPVEARRIADEARARVSPMGDSGRPEAAADAAQEPQDEPTALVARLDALEAHLAAVDRELEEVQWCVEDLDRSSSTYRYILGLLVSALGKAMGSQAMGWLYPEPSGQHLCPGRAQVPKRRAEAWTSERLVALAAEHGVTVRREDTRMEMLRALRRHVPALRGPVSPTGNRGGA